MRTYFAAAAVVVLIAVACGPNDEATATLPVATTGVPSSSSLSATTVGLSTTTEPTAATVTSPTSSTTPLPSPTPSRLPVTIEPANVSHLTPAPEVSYDRPELRYLALDDSYTIGEGVYPALRWPVRLIERLRSAGVAIAAPESVPRTGWATTELAVGIDGASPQGTFDIVTLLIGVNDQFRGQPVELFRQGFDGLLLRAIAFAGGLPSTVAVISIPDWGVMPLASGMDRSHIDTEIDLYNQTAREEAVQAGALFVDITGISREAETDLELLAPDRLPPFGVMYGRWVDLIFPVAAKILE